MTALIIALCFVSLMVVQFIGFKFGKAWASKQIKSEPQAIAPSGFKCPYCRVDVVGIRDLDLINHSLCITRSEDELDKVRAEVKNRPVEDEYFIDVRTYVYKSLSRVPSRHKNCYYWDNDVNARVDEAKVYRNGELIDTVYGETQKYTKELAERQVVIDKQRRKSKNNA